MKHGNLFWGIVFLLGAVLLILDKMDFLLGLNITQLLCTVFFVAVFIQSVKSISFGGMLFSLAFLAIVYDRELGIEALTPWTVMIAAGLGTIGLNLIFGNWKKCCKYNQSSQIPQGACNPYVDGGVHSMHGDNSKMETNFCSSVKYINAKKLTYAKVACNMGSCEVFFDNADAYEGNAVLKVEVNFGKITVFVPSNWIVVNEVKANFGACNMKRGRQPDVGPVIYIKGEANFGGVEICSI